MPEREAGREFRIVEEQLIEAPQSKLVLDKQFVTQFPAGAATPSVKNVTRAICGGSVVTVTNLMDGQNGQTVKILGDGFTTIAHGTRIKTNTAANKLLALLKVYTFTCFNIAGDLTWVEDDDISGGGGGGGAFAGALVYQSSAQSLTTSTAVPIQFHEVSYDTNSFWSGGAPTRLTIPAGVTRVRLSGNLRWVAHTTTIRQLYMSKNGATGDEGLPIHGQMPVTVAGQLTSINITSPVLDVETDDYFELIAFQGATINSSGNNFCWFALEVIS